MDSPLNSIDDQAEQSRFRAHSGALIARLARGQVMDVALLAVILAVAGWLRFLQTDRPFIGRHDYHAAFYSLSGAGRRLTEYYNWPPLTDALYRFSFLLFGESELASRILPISFSLGTIVLVYLIGRRLFDRETGLLAAALLAIFPGAIYFARIEHFSFFVALTIWAYSHWSEKRQGFLWLATASNLIGLGFSFAAPVIAVPATFVLAVAYRDKRGQVLLIGSTLLALVAWLTFVEIRVGLASLETSGDSISLLFDHVERSLWKEAVLTFFFRMFTPVALVAAVVWLVSLLDRCTLGDWVLIAWVAGMMFWLVNAPYHSRIHDFWWLPLATPLALISARASLKILTSSLGRAGAAALMLCFSAWMSVDATREYLDWREHGVSPVEFGQTVRPYLHDGDTVIGWYPNEIFYTDAPGYISGMIRDEQEYSVILARDRPAVIVLASNDHIWFYQRAWDAGYVPFLLYGWVTFFRADTAQVAAADNADREASLQAIGALQAGSFLRAPDDAVIYYYYDWGLKAPLSAMTATTLGLDAGLIDVHDVPASLLDAVPPGPAIAELKENSVVSTTGGQKYVVRNGRKSSVETPAALERLGLAKAPVVILPDALIALIPEGATVGASR